VPASCIAVLRSVAQRTAGVPTGGSGEAQNSDRGFRSVRSNVDCRHQPRGDAQRSGKHDAFDADNAFARHARSPIAARAAGDRGRALANLDSPTPAGFSFVRPSPQARLEGPAGIERMSECRIKDARPQGANRLGFRDRVLERALSHRRAIRARRTAGPCRWC